MSAPSVGTITRAAALSVSFGLFAVQGWPLWTAGVLAWLSGFLAGVAVVAALMVWLK